MPLKDNSVLNISTYTNYIVHDSVREVIELKNEVIIKGTFIKKTSYAILTTQRLLLFKNREAYLNKKKPEKNYKLFEHDYQVNSRILKILSNNNIIQELIFPTSELAIYWWESINQIKIPPLVTYDHEESTLKNSQIQSQPNQFKNNIFSQSIIEGINNVDLLSSHLFQERKGSKMGNSISSVIFQNKDKSDTKKRTRKPRSKKKVNFKEDLHKEYLIGKNNSQIEDVNNSVELYSRSSKRNSLEIAKDNEDNESSYDDEHVEIDPHELQNSKLTHSWISNSHETDGKLMITIEQGKTKSKGKTNQKIESNNKSNTSEMITNNNHTTSQFDCLKSAHMEIMIIPKENKTTKLGDDKEKEKNNPNSSKAKEGNESLPNWNTTPIAISKLESVNPNDISGDSDLLISNHSKYKRVKNSSNKQKSNGSEINSKSGSQSMDNSKTMSLISKDDTINIGYINAFDNRKKKCDMPTSNIKIHHTTIENPEKELREQLQKQQDDKAKIREKAKELHNDKSTRHFFADYEALLYQKNLDKQKTDTLKIRGKPLKHPIIPRIPIPSNTPSTASSFLNKKNNENQKQNDHSQNSSLVFPMSYHPQTERTEHSRSASQMIKIIPNKQLPALQGDRDVQPNYDLYQGKLNNDNSKTLGPLPHQTTIHIFNNDDDDNVYNKGKINANQSEFLKDNYTLKTNQNASEKSSIVFVEKVYKTKVSENKTSVIKPSTFIEQLLENRYSRIMLRMSIKEETQNSTFISRLYDFLSSIITTNDTSVTILKCLYKRLPDIIRKRLSKDDLSLISPNEEEEQEVYTFTQSNNCIISQNNSHSPLNTPLTDMKKLIQRDMNTLKLIFENFMKELNKANNHPELKDGQTQFNQKVDKIISELDE